MKPSPAPKENSAATFRRLFPQRAKSGWDPNQKPPTLQELRETLSRFGDSEDLYRPQENMEFEEVRQGVDIIGDTHGHARELKELLGLLGYRQSAGSFRHDAGRRVLFLGDFIDRGPNILETLQIARRMVEEGNAMAIMGNHEMNALRYHTRDADGRPLREHSAKNTRHHKETLEQIPPKEMDGWLEWFSDLPLWLDLGSLRAVHACWDEAAMERVKAFGPMRGEALLATSQNGTPGHSVVSQLLNGPEGFLPDGLVHETDDVLLLRRIRG